MYRVPISTYRLQMNASFRFEDARRIVDYLAKLGISDVYSSPILKARKGSGHGYDVVDPHVLNPELGTEDDFSALHEDLKRNGMGFVLDVVPNHMAASPENSWWMSVLENGAQSRFLHYFDIDWRPVPTASGETVNKVLLPILGKPYGEALESREIQLAFDQEGFHFNYYDKRLPLAPHTYVMVLRECVEALPAEGVAIEIRDLVAGQDAIANSRFLKDTLWRVHEQSPQFRDALAAAIETFNGKAGDSQSFNAIDALLDAQWYRLAYWRIATHKINYRRFFDVTDLVGVRIENPEVFEAHHKRIIGLIQEEKVTGLRIDHIDGLYDPAGTLLKLQLRMGSRSGAVSGEETPSYVEGRGESGQTPHAFYVVIEKILARDERLRADFAVDGTSGYDFLDTVNALFVDSDGLRELDRFYVDFTGLDQSFHEICYRRKKQVIHELFSGEMRGLGKQLAELSLHDRNARDFVPSDLLVALTEVTACMTVYRTYVREGEICPDDAARVRSAVAEARKRAGTEIDDRIFGFLEKVLLLEPPAHLQHEHDRWAAFVMRFQQFTGRVMAKGVEDTSFYNYNRLISLNEVGGEPERGESFDPVAELHAFNAHVAEKWPHTMNTTSTHDTKRSEDVRARIHVLSEIASEWAEAARTWSTATAALRKDAVPGPNEELLVLQTILGMWPLEKSEESDVVPRLRQYLEKAAREAKTHTSWIAPDGEYEQRYLDYAEALVRDEEFLALFRPLQERVAFHGFLNSLSQVAIKILSPGLPDFYQGSEVWDFSLVDPDNRRPVDYEKRARMLDALHDAAPSSLLESWRDGRVKMFVTTKLLELRKRRIDVLRQGSYEPLSATGAHASSVFAFKRGEDVLVITPRLTTRFGGALPLGDVWEGTTIDVDGEWRNVLTGETVRGPVKLADALRTFVVGVFER